MAKEPGNKSSPKGHRDSERKDSESGGGGVPSSGPFRLRVLSYNIHQGLTIHRRQIALSILKEAIQSLKADIVLLQEVAGTTSGHSAKHGGTPGVSTFQLEELADEIWPYFAYGKNAIFSGGFHGNAILSRFPISEWSNVDITVSPLPTRGLLHGKIRIPGRDLTLHVMGVHLGLLQYERRAQLKRVCRYVQKETSPNSICVIGGDFNDWRQKVTKGFSKTLKLDEAFLRKYSRHALTFPSRLPVLRLDRIYFRGLELEGAKCLRGKPWFFLSDHLPLMADFTVS